MAYAKANPGKITWGSQGFGTSPHLLVEMFKLEAGVNIVHVPYRGTAPMLSAILAGEVQMVVDTSTTSLPAHPIRQDAPAGGRRPLSASRNCRTSRPRPRWGIRSCKAPFWLGVVAPAGTPPAIINKLNAAFRESLAPAETRARLDTLGAEIKIGTPAEFGKMLADELAQWTAVVKAANIKVE